jgi:hypothetical protein
MRDLLRPLRLPGRLLLAQQVAGSVRSCSVAKLIYSMAIIVLWLDGTLVAQHTMR